MPTISTPTHRRFYFPKLLPLPPAPPPASCPMLFPPFAFHLSSPDPTSSCYRYSFVIFLLSSLSFSHPSPFTTLSVLLWFLSLLSNFLVCHHFYVRSISMSFYSMSTRFFIPPSCTLSPTLFSVLTLFCPVSSFLPPRTISSCSFFHVSPSFSSCSFFHHLSYFDFQLFSALPPLLTSIHSYSLMSFASHSSTCFLFSRLLTPSLLPSLLPRLLPSLLPRLLPSLLPRLLPRLLSLPGATYPCT